ncbi:MAG: hypothetical protein V8S74_10370 [Lachnospirales bacterium]
MKNKKCLGFLILTIILVISMFSSAFANSLGSWTCIQESRTKFTVGQVLNNVSCLNINADGQHSEYCTFVSDFDVEPGDVVSISFAASFRGDKNRIEEAVSACGASLTAENGKTILSADSVVLGWTDAYQNKEVEITEETAGKLTFEVYLEGTGTNGVSVRFDDLYIEINGEEV